MNLKQHHLGGNYAPPNIRPPQWHSLSPPLTPFIPAENQCIVVWRISDARSVMAWPPGDTMLM